MNSLTVFGLIVIIISAICYFLRDRSKWWTLAFALFCIPGAIYGYLAGSWSFALFEGMWSLIGFYRFWRERNSN